MSQSGLSASGVSEGYFNNNQHLESQKMLQKYPNIERFAITKLQREAKDHGRSIQPLVSHFNPYGMHEFLRKMISYLFCNSLFAFICIEYLRPKLENMHREYIFSNPYLLSINLVVISCIVVAIKFFWTRIQEYEKNKSVGNWMYAFYNLSISFVYLHLYYQYFNTYFLKLCAQNIDKGGN